MENKSHALAAGTFVLAVAALLVALAAWLTRDTGEHRPFEISSREGVTGLQPQAPVRYKGVTVGRVQSIALDQQTLGNVLIRIAVDGTAPISPTTFATLGFQGVTGLAFIQLDDTGPTSAVLASSDEQPGRIPMRPSLMSRLSDQGAGLLTQLDEATQRVSQLLAAPNQKKLMDAVGNIGQAAANIGQLAQQANQANLPALAQEAGATLKSLHTTSDRLGQSADAIGASADAFKGMSLRMSEPGGTLDRIAEGTTTLTATGQSLNATLVPRLNRTVDDTARTVRHISRAVESVSDNPQALLLGNGVTPPGPGEPGFAPPTPK
jgi:phospholipid/cholesterol/gamma-HCH transport system substrate-binding protein|nr:MlaD family protein [Rhodoferax sp.]